MNLQTPAQVNISPPYGGKESAKYRYQSLCRTASLMRFNVFVQSLASHSLEQHRTSRLLEVTYTRVDRYKTV